MISYVPVISLLIEIFVIYFIPTFLVPITTFPIISSIYFGNIDFYRSYLFEPVLVSCDHFGECHQVTEILNMHMQV